MAKLVEFCKINMGQSPDSSSYNDIGKGMPFFQGNADFGNVHPKVRVWCDAPTKIAHPNDILISVRAPIGALNIANIECCIGRGLASLTADKNKCHQKYLWYALESKVDELNSKGTGSTFKAISKSVLFDTEIPLPSLNGQKEISDIFDRITSLIADRKQQLKDLENLVKSRFIELFGNDDYPSEPLNNNIIEMFIGPFGSSLKNEYFVDKSDGYCMVYEQKHAIQKTMSVPTRYVPKSKYEELKRFTVFGGDIIVSCRGTIGEVFTVPFDAPMGIMHPSIMKIRLDTNKYNQKFFVFALEQYMNEHNAEAKGSGVKMAVSATVLGQSDFVIPPMDVQNQFATFVEQTDKLKFEVKEALEKLETLKKSLMQQYFG